MNETTLTMEIDGCSKCLAFIGIFVLCANKTMRFYGGIGIIYLFIVHLFHSLDCLCPDTPYFQVIHFHSALAGLENLLLPMPGCRL